MMEKIVIIGTLVCVASCCLITNCPRGGKRGESPMLSIPSLIRECPKCGPGHQGQCFGPNICCGLFGCYLATPETFVCRGESLYSHPCIAGFSMCRDNTGRCASNGICCSQDSCQVDSSCKIDEDFHNERKFQDYNRFITETES